ncbi:hypothetical protein A3K34_01575 [candidate division WWE3 bacterium RIFOXYC1_FULL_40_10]|uniref:Uncharacterized protein n=1 Tax=candidate division WWE3 bacterium RIFOXYA2_FULL_46_9 TaxID=1802636 RepID=A0A1F4W2I5_UNCKA|nr:MAG: hypothetical protein A3K58_01575 [candidate division WWE3 bacterium RIFOXYB1_FULL_40_22]OGC61555.1 MAG: hypothetical protein A3K37_01575 [candidate division WWE3 bacterium RIFOXYA1_FULL_40_11]OGC63601.1 MAG: hypothetical protein A2264_04515 [candidate division WWE3 bacterium RIFOXYA2_FULL_46_9]OGC64766.1 MAG: hypothetical protein A2326_01880 [candidate division WWE3 bacterium RIFOXYB2_FULL_41_6]OGC65938.1 MAG: hypothetical protein A3K34_01575 [candidate division WWE3 bacterium RIFOXYC1_
MNNVSLSLLVALLSWLLSGVFHFCLLTWMPNAVQKKITEKNRVGAGFFFLGITLMIFAYLFSSGLLPVNYGIYQLGTSIGMVFAFFSGECTMVGGLIALPDKWTNPLLESKNTKYGMAVILVLMILFAFSSLI